MSTSSAASDEPAASSVPAGHYPVSPVEPGHTEPVPRRIRATFGGRTVLDTTLAHYVWEHPYYPQFYIPAADVTTSLLVDQGVSEQTDRGEVAVRSLLSGERRIEGAARFLASSTVPGLDNTYRFEWSAMDSWYEEDEQVFAHPRSPYVRVDALRSSRHVRVEKDGVVLAESTSPVAVFETGLPPRWYLDRTDVNWEHLVSSDTETLCPYKGVTSAYWSVVTETATYEDLVWGYDYPTRQLSPITGLVCFYDEHVDLTVE